MNTLRLNASGARMRPAVSAIALAAALIMSAPAVTAQAPQRPPRVHAKLDGFDVAPNSGKAPNQVAGASRSIGGIVLYAPQEGKAYTLTPTFTWKADDPQATYLFKVAPAKDPQNFLVTGKATGGSYTYPADAPALEPGMTYIFTVQPENDMLGGATSAKLLIVGGKEREEIAAALAAAAASSDPELAKARVYTQKRLWFDAVDAYTKLIAQSPERAVLYQARADIYDQLPQTKALADADEAKVQP